jgi:hypothetical protein
MAPELTPSTETFLGDVAINLHVAEPGRPTTA